MAKKARSAIVDGFEDAAETAVAARRAEPKRLKAWNGVRPAKPGEAGERYADAVKRLRPVIVVDRDGKPVRNVTHGKLLESVVERAGVELATEGKRPKLVRCVDCRDPVSVPVHGNGRLPQRCKPCQVVFRRLAACESSKARHRREYALRPPRPKFVICRCGARQDFGPRGRIPTLCDVCRIYKHRDHYKATGKAAAWSRGWLSTFE